MIDLQSSNSIINLAINKVGVKDIAYPVVVAFDENTRQHSVANFDMYVSLASSERGTHMSRFLEILNSQAWELSIPAMDELLKVTQEKLKSEDVFISASFKFFLAKYAPISRIKSLMDYDVTLIATRKNNNNKLSAKLKIPVTTLCPCSKELAKYNAHNQRSYVSIMLHTDSAINIADIINLVESTGSCGVFGILKREDEKFVTETAYENPKFVEDMAREIAEKFNNNHSISSYTIEVENLESIHNHAAYARIDSIDS